jgi:CBS domain-containing protein
MAGAASAVSGGGTPPEQEDTMQRVSDIMSRNAATVAPGATIQRAAQLMRDGDIGALPVCDGQQLVGMITDRDLALRGSALGKTPQDAHVDEIMSGEVRWCYEDQLLDEVMTQMADAQVRRIPVVTHDAARRLVGIVALGDLATRAGLDARRDLDDVTEMVSRPGNPNVPLQRIVGQGGESGTRDSADGGSDGAGKAGAGGKA